MNQTLKACVIGHPVSHSKSPLIHTYWIEQHGINGSYTAVDIAPENLKDGVQKLIDDGYCGFNITLPHKESMIDLCDEIDETAKVIGAVNTVVIRDGKLYGSNTDAFGFLENLKHEAPDTLLKDRPAVILGAGGAARAAIYALLEENIPEIRLTNRTFEKAETLQKIAPEKIHVIPWAQREDALTAAGLLVNTTSLGMKGQPPLDIDLNDTQHFMTAYDIVYTPLMTPLLQQAQKNGNNVVTGIGMLLHQARPAFESWFGVLPDIDQNLMDKVLQP